MKTKTEETKVNCTLKIKRNNHTLALNEFVLGSTEYDPGSRRRSCWYPIVILELPYWIRFMTISDGTIWTKAETDVTNCGTANICTVNLNS